MGTGEINSTDVAGGMCVLNMNVNLNMRREGELAFRSNSYDAFLNWGH